MVTKGEMRMKKIQLILLMLNLVFVVSIKAQDTSRKISLGYDVVIGKTLELIPKKGDRIEDFVPKGWTIPSKAKGDLNGDGLNDYALWLSSNLKEGEDSNNGVPGIIAVLFAESGGKFFLQGVNHHLGSEISSPQNERDFYELKIERGVLIVNLNFGGSYRKDVTFRFRQDAAAGGNLMLIGFDNRNYCVSCNDLSAKWDMSENYLTGIRIDTDYKEDKRRDSSTGLMAIDKKRKIQRISVSFEKARLNFDNLPDLRPF